MYPNFVNITIVICSLHFVIVFCVIFLLGAIKSLCYVMLCYVMCAYARECECVFLYVCVSALICACVLICMGMAACYMLINVISYTFEYSNIIQVVVG